MPAARRNPVLAILRAIRLPLPAPLVASLEAGHARVAAERRANETLLLACEGLLRRTDAAMVGRHGDPGQPGWAGTLDAFDADTAAHEADRARLVNLLARTRSRGARDAAWRELATLDHARARRWEVRETEWAERRAAWRGIAGAASAERLRLPPATD